MDRQRRVVVYGGSVILGTIGASLMRYRGLDVIQLSAPMPDAAELAALWPDVILFDLAAGRPEAAFALLSTCANLLLVGISPDSNRVWQWASEQSDIASTDDFVHLISQIQTAEDDKVRLE